MTIFCVKRFEKGKKKRKHFDVEIVHKHNLSGQRPQNNKLKTKEKQKSPPALVLIYVFIQNFRRKNEERKKF